MAVCWCYIGEPGSGNTGINKSVLVYEVILGKTYTLWNIMCRNLRNKVNFIKDARSVFLYHYNRSQILQYVMSTT